MRRLRNWWRDAFHRKAIWSHARLVKQDIVFIWWMAKRDGATYQRVYGKPKP